MERRGTSIKDRTGESGIFQTILIAVLLKYYCREKILLNCVVGLDIRKVLVMMFDFKTTLIDT